MSVEEYCLKFSTLYRYALSLVSNPRDEMSRFVTGVAYLVREESRTAMLHDDKYFPRLMLYAQPIEDSKLRRISRNFKSSVASDQVQTRFRKRAQTQDGPSVPMMEFYKGYVSSNGKPTCDTFGKNILVSVYLVPVLALDVKNMGTK